MSLNIPGLIKNNMLKINLGKKYLKKVDIFIINRSLHHCTNPFKKNVNLFKKWIYIN